jgi:flagellar hook-length control protein FliK
VAQVLNGLETLRSSGGRSLHLQLFPENLGQVDLRLITRDDGLHVRILAESAATGATLEHSLPDLQRALQAAGIEVSSFSVGLGSHAAHGEAAQEQARPQSGRPAQAHLSQGDESAAPDAAAPRVRWTNSLVDYQV